jgi:nucleotide-binding universal stress UspA family protein
VASKTYLVAVDFSKNSEAALKHAMKLARQNGSKLLLVHVISMRTVNPPQEPFLTYQNLLRKDAQERLNKLVRRNGLKHSEYRSFILMGEDPAQGIARQAKRSRASMIIMGSRGRPGVQRLLLGSVAERTLRYADCPVLIVKQ